MKIETQEKIHSVVDRTLIVLIILAALCYFVATMRAGEAVPAGATGIIIDTNKWATTATSHAFEWQAADSQNLILTVRGIECDVITTQTGSLSYTPQVYKRPLRAEDCTAELWTADGKHYKAKWEEVKP